MIGITGSSGFLGSAFIEHFPSAVRIYREGQQTRPAPGVHLNGDDVRIKASLEGIQTLFHFGTSNHPRTDISHFFDDFNSSTNPLKIIELWAEANPGGHLVFPSSGGAIYDPSYTAAALKESDAIRPWSPYGIQKILLEHYIELIAARYSISATIVRIANPYGTIFKQDRKHGFIGVAIDAMKTNEVLKIFGSDQIIRDYFHISDLMNLFEKIVSSDVKGVKTYNVGSGTGTSLREVVNTIERLSGRQLKTLLVESELQCPWNILDCKKVKDELNWEAKVTLADGIQRMLKI